MLPAKLPHMRINVEIELVDGVQPTMFEHALLAALETNPAVKSVTIENPDTDSDWTDEELEHLVQLGPERTRVSIEETRYLYLRISPSLKIGVRKQELALFEFLSVSPVYSGQKEFHAALSAYRSAIYGECVFAESTPAIASAVYSKLRAKLEDTTVCLVARRGVYGFQSCWRPVNGRQAQIRRPSALMDPNVSLDDAIRGLVDGPEDE